MAPEELEKWIEKTANAAWAAAEDAAACRFLLGNLVVELHKTGKMDGRALTLKLRDQVHGLEDLRVRRSATALMEELLLQLDAAERPPEVH